MFLFDEGTTILKNIINSQYVKLYYFNEQINLSTKYFSDIFFTTLAKKMHYHTKYFIEIIYNIFWNITTDIFFVNFCHISRFFGRIFHHFQRGNS
jgi:hypothetical protein